jgi:hypothetical protein
MAFAILSIAPVLVITYRKMAKPSAWRTTDHDDLSRYSFHDVSLAGSDPARKRAFGLEPGKESAIECSERACTVIFAHSVV